METMNGALGIAQTDIGREVERIYAQMHNIPIVEREESPSPPLSQSQSDSASGQSPYELLSEDERNWLQWREYLQRDPATAITHLAEALGVSVSPTPSAASASEGGEGDADNPLDYLDEYTRRAIEAYVHQLLSPYTEQLQTLASAAQLFYAEQLRASAAQQIRELHKEDAPAIGDLTEEAVQSILQIAAERFNWNLEDAYNYWVAPKLRARQRQRMQPREYQPTPPVNASPGDILRALKAERDGGE